MFGYCVGEQYPVVWILHVSIFVVWAGAIFQLKSNPEIKQLEKKGSRNSQLLLLIAFKSTQKPMIVLAEFTFVYTIFSFLFFIKNSKNGISGIIDQKFVLHNRGEVLQKNPKSNT